MVSSLSSFTTLANAASIDPSLLGFLGLAGSAAGASTSSSKRTDRALSGSDLGPTVTARLLARAGWPDIVELACLEGMEMKPEVPRGALLGLATLPETD